MVDSTISVVVALFDAGDGVPPVIRQAAAEVGPGDEIIVVDARLDPRTPFPNDLGRPFAVLDAAGQRPGAAFNAGVLGCRSDRILVLRGEDSLSSGWLARARAVLADWPDLAFVIEGRRPLGLRRTVDLASLLLVPHASSTVFLRREACAAVCGFDEGALGAERFDLLARMLLHGYRGFTVKESDRAEGGAERREDPRWYVLEHHREALEARAADVLDEAEQWVTELEDRASDLQRRRVLLRAERHGLTTEAKRLSASLRQSGRRAIEWGDLQRISPLSSVWGFDRGGALDRHYIEHFLEAHRGDIAGAVLEVGDDTYTRRFGGDRVERSEVVDVEARNPAATIVADLRDANTIPSSSFDCFIMTQTVYLVDDMAAVVREAARVLKPGGVLLATLPCATRLEPRVGMDHDFWRLSAEAARRLFASAFPADSVEVTTYGNLLASVAFLYGVGRYELTSEELESVDPRYPLTIGVRAQAPESAKGQPA
jgi:SAM-dependent methyltransferase